MIFWINLSKNTKTFYIYLLHMTVTSAFLLKLLNETKVIFFCTFYSHFHLTTNTVPIYFAPVNECSKIFHLSRYFMISFEQRVSAALLPCITTIDHVTGSAFMAPSAPGVSNLEISSLSFCIVSFFCFSLSLSSVISYRILRFAFWIFTELFSFFSSTENNNKTIQ